MLVPPWLESLLSADFFSACATHTDAPRSECNMFCIDCRRSDAFCYYCRSSRHRDHLVVQIRRSSYNDVVRVVEIEKVLDVSGVQTYVINSARVMFLKERAQSKSSGKGVSHHLCEICGRSLLDPFRFCSLGCKVAGIKKNGNATFVLNGKIENRSEETQQKDKETGGGSRAHQTHSNSSSSSSRRRRRRKGIPHRAPFGIALLIN